MILSEELKTRTPFSEYLQTRREEKTRINLHKFLRSIVGDPNAFLELAKDDKHKAEECLINYVVEKRGKLAPTTVTVFMSALKGFLEFNEVSLNWRKVKGTMDRARFVANDRAPTKEEIRKLLDVCDLRTRACVLVLSSSGIRAGGLCGLKIDDFNFLDSGIARLRIYAGTIDEYLTFISAEATIAVRAYLDARIQAGEHVTPSSVFLRDKWTYSNDRSKLDPDIVRPVNENVLHKIIAFLWGKAGVRDLKDKSPRKEFKAIHGFRKYFKTAAARAFTNRDDVELLMGHALNYYKPEIEYLEEAYLKAQPALMISEVSEIKEKAEIKDKVHNEEIKDVRLLLFDKDQQLQRLQGIVEKIGEEHESMKAGWNELKPELERLRKAAKQN